MKNILYISLLSVGLISSCDEQANGGHEGHNQQAPQATDTTTIPDPHAGHQMQTDAPVDHSNMLVLTDREKYLAGIKTDTLRKSAFEQTVSALGIVVADEATRTTVAVRVSGRIERLHARNPGEMVTNGAPLYDLYSEVLIAEQQDLIVLINSNASQDLITAARNKLKLHGLTQKQVGDVERSKKATQVLTIYSSASGYISNLPVREGQYVNEGDILFEIESLDVVRVNVQVYPGEISGFTSAQKYRVGEDTARTVTLLFDNPALEPTSKIYNIYLRVTNKDHALRPGMMVTVEAIAQVDSTLTIPSTSLLSEQGMKFTWVLEPDGMFNRRMVMTGRSNGHQVEIISGVQPGDCIVVNGIYLLNSEFILRKGANSMHSMHNHGG